MGIYLTSPLSFLLWKIPSILIARCNHKVLTDLSLALCVCHWLCSFSRGHGETSVCGVSMLLGREGGCKNNVPSRKVNDSIITSPLGGVIAFFLSLYLNSVSFSLLWHHSQKTKTKHSKPPNLANRPCFGKIFPLEAFFIWYIRITKFKLINIKQTRGLQLDVVFCCSNKMGRKIKPTLLLLSKINIKLLANRLWNKTNIEVFLLLFPLQSCALASNESGLCLLCLNIHLKESWIFGVHICEATSLAPCVEWDSSGHSGWLQQVLLVFLSRSCFYNRWGWWFLWHLQERGGVQCFRVGCSELSKWSLGRLQHWILCGRKLGNAFMELSHLLLWMTCLVTTTCCSHLWVSWRLETQWVFGACLFPQSCHREEVIAHQICQQLTVGAQ